MTGNHEDFSSRQHSEEVARCFIKKLASIILKNSRKEPVSESFFNKVLSLTLLKIDSGVSVFL